MRKAINFVAVLTVVGVLLSMLTVVSMAESADRYYHGELTVNTYWTPQKDRYEYIQYRLPGMVITKQGTVIIYGEARTDQNTGSAPAWSTDQNLMDIYLRRSTDGGKTFEPAIYIARGEDYVADGLGETMNNPVMTVGNDGRLHLLFSCDVGEKGLFYTFSDDDGESWTTPKNIKNSIAGASSYNWIACGPGHGVCLDNGRLVVPVWVTSQYLVYTIYSDDNGETWKLGARVSGNKDESAITKLSGGGVIISSRQYSLPYDEDTNASHTEHNSYRMIAASDDGSSKWSTSAYNTYLPDPACEGSMCYVDVPGLPYALLHINCNSKIDRKNITVRCSFDDGVTWGKSIVIDADAGGYSDIAVTEDGKVYVVYERDAGKQVMLATFSFYDAFCVDDASTITTTNRFRSLKNIVHESSDVELSKSSSGELSVKLTDVENPSAVFDFQQITKNINVSKLSVLAIKIKASVASSSDELQCGVLIRSGRNTISRSEAYLPVKFVNDGEYHTVVVELNDRDAIKGNLYSMEMQFYSAKETGSVGDTYEISDIGFFASADEAYAVYGGAPVSSDDTETDVSTDTQTGNDTSERGCKSAIGVSFSSVMLVGIGTMIIRRKKRK